jgi:hypothetical protein
VRNIQVPQLAFGHHFGEAIRCAAKEAVVRRSLVFVLVGALLGLGAGMPAQAAQTDGALTTGPQPYADPAFGSACEWHRFGEGETPPWWLYLREPLCVEYSKRDITFDNGGWLLFLLAEPARFAIAIPSCRYWQLDHWSIQESQGDVPIVAWDGSYWFDKRLRRAGLRLQNFRVHGQSVGIGDVAAAVRPWFPALADALASYGSGPGETGLTVDLGYDLFCP